MSNQLIEAQRSAIYLGLKENGANPALHVSKSTVRCEIKRNLKPDGSYVLKYA